MTQATRVLLFNVLTNWYTAKTGECLPNHPGRNQTYQDKSLDCETDEVSYKFFFWSIISMIDNTINNISWLTLSDIAGLPDQPSTYSGVRSAWRRGKYHKTQLRDGGPGKHKQVFIHISEMSDNARTVLATRNDEDIDDAVERACGHIDTFDLNLFGPARTYVLLSAIVNLYGVNHVKHILNILTNTSQSRPSYPIPSKKGISIDDLASDPVPVDVLDPGDLAAQQEVDP